MEEIEVLYMKSHAQPLHLWIARINNHSVGHVHMLEESDGRLKLLDAWVDERHRRKGIFNKLWQARMEFIQERFKGRTVYAWCKPASLPQNIKNGFTPGETVTYVEKIIE